MPFWYRIATTDLNRANNISCSQCNFHYWSVRIIVTDLRSDLVLLDTWCEHQMYHIWLNLHITDKHSAWGLSCGSVSDSGSFLTVTSDSFAFQYFDLVFAFLTLSSHSDIQTLIDQTMRSQWPRNNNLEKMNTKAGYTERKKKNYKNHHTGKVTR